MKICSTSEYDRFSFGRNWQSFVSSINEDQILEAEISLKLMLDVESLRGKSFLDVGSGSGLFSLAAARLGARRIHSFDYDQDSVVCTKGLKEKFFSEFVNWSAEHGSVLDTQYLKGLGTFDVVYSWGVLHHTGSMWQALENIISLVAEDGQLFIAIYNDQGIISKVWKFIKKIYNSIPVFMRPLYVVAIWTPFELISMIKQIISGRLPWHHWKTYKKKRGMSIVHDIIDWIGGYPFETASPERIFLFFKKEGFVLDQLKTKNGMGCNEFVFRKLKRNI